MHLEAFEDSGWILYEDLREPSFRNCHFVHAKRRNFRPLSESNFELLGDFKKMKRFTKEVGLGVVDVHTHRIESTDEVVGNLKKSLKVFKPEQIYPDPDCGLKTRSPEEAKAKLQVIAEATRIVREEL